MQRAKHGSDNKKDKTINSKTPQTPPIWGHNGKRGEKYGIQDG